MEYTLKIIILNMAFLYYPPTLWTLEKQLLLSGTWTKLSFEINCNEEICWKGDLNLNSFFSQKDTSTTPFCTHSFSISKT